MPPILRGLAALGLSALLAACEDNQSAQSWPHHPNDVAQVSKNTEYGGMPNFRATLSKADMIALRAYFVADRKAGELKDRARHPLDLGRYGKLHDFMHIRCLGQIIDG